MKKLYFIMLLLSLCSSFTSCVTINSKTECENEIEVKKNQNGSVTIFNIKSICDTNIRTYKDFTYNMERKTVTYNEIQEDSVIFGIMSPVENAKNHFILMISGFFSSWYNIAPLKAEFNNAGYPIVEVNYRGTSSMDMYEKTFGIKEVDDFLCIVKYLKETYGANTKISVYANSFGGLIALNAINRTEDIYKVCYEAFLYDLDKIEQKFLDGGPAARLLVGDMSFKNHQYFYPKVQLPIINPKLPMLFYWGENDDQAPKKDIETVRELLKDKNATLKIVPKVGHSFRFGYPLTQQEVDQHNMSIVRFLTE
ncbi:MAG: prolyl oligopeptidase family serine peptidase [Candidatus Kapabacteria bacterium]|nr:prolyl oligopeptidase family serine peptidase [Candidatus Kapabacteria bacterium]